MNPVVRLVICCLAVLLSLAFCESAQDDKKEESRWPPKALTRDDCEKLARLSADQIRAQLGPPRHINRQILYHRYVEQWIYDEPYFVRFEIDYARNKKPHLLTVQTLRPAKL
jgi:hypothetical protein